MTRQARCASNVRRWLALGAPAALAACVATAQPAPSRGIVVGGPPPAPLAEARPAPPQAGATWVAGYWHWTGMRYAWIPGHWETPPAGAYWAPPRYVSSDGSYFYEPGQWQRGAAVPPAPPSASPRANALR